MKNIVKNILNENEINNNNSSNKESNNYIPKIYRNMLDSIRHIPNIKKRCKHCDNKTFL